MNSLRVIRLDLIILSLGSIVFPLASAEAVAQVAATPVAESDVNQVLPFPQNRVRDYYVRQAAGYFSSKQPIPKLIPDFPGLDGGSFGHWGQNPEADNFDETLNDVDYGGLLSQVINHFGQTTFKGISLRFGDDGGMTALFDPEQLTFTDVWQGDLVKWQSQRYGITSGVSPAGEQVPGLNSSKWLMPEGTPTKYIGFHRNGDRVVFVYRIGDARIYDHIWQQDGQAVRSLSVEGRLPQDVVLSGALAAKPDDGQTKALASAAQPQWSGMTVTTVGQLGSTDGPYTIDTLTVPYRSANPFRSPMRIGGFDILPDGRIAVSTLCGDVWLVDGVDDDLDQLTWRRFAAGLYQPLGLVVRDGKVIVLGRDQLTRLHDTNGDGEADFYECMTNDFPTSSGSNFALTLHQDAPGNFYWFTRSEKFGMTKYTPGGRPESIAKGLRGTNGTGVSPDGRIVFATAQEGSYTPASAIFEVGGGSYHGFLGPREEAGEYGYQMPLCFIPRGIDNSCGDIAFLPHDDRFGPLAGTMVGTSFGYCQHYMILRETVGDTVQGGVVPLPGDFLSGAHRSRFNPRDGHFYVAGTDGWESYAKENGSLQRVRYVGGDMHLPRAVETHENGLLVRFNCEVDRKSVHVENVFCEQWNYLYSKAYGSPEFSVADPARRGHDHVPVRSVTLLEDGRSVFVEIPHLHPVMQFHLTMRLMTRDRRTTSDNREFTPDIYYSIFQQRKPFTEFDGYTPIARKKRYPRFPVAKQYPRDPRLLAQEELGKTKGEVVPVEIKAVPGLQYKPRRVRVPPGRRIGLTFRNADPSMPHNFVLVHSDRLQPIGEGAMLLAADPRAIATHYVPNDPGVICLSPILNPLNQYTIYFDSPQEKGAYPFVCTFPGHWQVMQGVLYVADEGDELPEEPETAPTRQFVRMWTTADLADDLTDDLTTGVDQRQRRSFDRGREMFSVAGCIKCHVIAGQGAKLGPDLTDVRKRFQGAKLLQQVLEPSCEINKQFQAYVVLTDEGRAVTGLMVKDEPDAIHLLPNPLKPEELVIIPRHEIDELQASKISTMPKGLLMTLTKNEILDLLLYMESGGIASRVGIDQ